VSGKRDGLVFVFGAQGTQWPGMGQDLLESEPAFQAAVEQCDAEVRRRGGWSLSAELRTPPAAYRAHRDYRFVQPALTSLQIGLVRVLEERGVRAAGVAALSMGEAAGAWCAGILDLPEAVQVALCTAGLAETHLPPGLMAFVRADWDAAGELVRPVEDRVARAVELGTALTVISGEEEAVETVLASAARAGVGIGRLPLAQAYHSPSVEALRRSFVGCLAGLRPRADRVPLYSSATGGAHSGHESSPEHWWRICSAPSRFLSLARAMLRDGFRRFIEIGPHPMLADSIRDAAAGMGAAVRVEAVLDRRRGAAGLDEAVARLKDDAT